jgi:hypothetical protein
MIERGGTLGRALFGAIACGFLGAGCEPTALQADAAADAEVEDGSTRDSSASDGAAKDLDSARADVGPEDAMPPNVDAADAEAENEASAADASADAFSDAESVDTGDATLSDAPLSDAATDATLSDSPSGVGDGATVGPTHCVPDDALSVDAGLSVVSANLGVLGSFPCGATLPTGSILLTNASTAPIAWTATPAGDAVVDMTGSTLDPGECLAVTVQLPDFQAAANDGLGLRRGEVTVAYGSTTQNFFFALDVYGALWSVPPTVDLGTVTLTPDSIPADGGTPQGSVGGGAGFPVGLLECPQAQCTFAGQAPTMCTFGTAGDSVLQSGCGNGCGFPFEVGVLRPLILGGFGISPGPNVQLFLSNTGSACQASIQVGGVASPGVYTYQLGGDSCGDGGTGIATFTVLPPPSNEL